jgi:ANTAR domain
MNQALKWVCTAPDTLPASVRDALVRAGCTVLAPGQAQAGTDWVLVPQAEWVALQARVQEQELLLEDRRWTDRAKAVLMQTQQLDEAPAYKLLRDAAMQAQVKLPRLARQLVQQHERAEGLERAAAQRMLSQRLVRLQAQATLLPDQADQARQLQRDAAERIEGNLQRLLELLHGPIRETELAAVTACWAELQPLLLPAQGTLGALDEAAQRLVDASESLVSALLEEGFERPLRLLALCARQRLLCQRLVKEALLAQADASYEPQRLAEDLEAFLQALQVLRNAPLKAGGLQEAFDTVDADWGRLVRALRQGGGTQALSDLCAASERLFHGLDTLTDVVQRSLQTLLS